MPFCAQCGAEGQGNFCPSCGAPRAAAATSGAPVSAQASQLDENVAAALCYILGVLSGIVFLVLEPYNRNHEIRFHAFQSIFVFGAVFVASTFLMFLSYVPLIGLLSLLLLPLLYMATFALWLVLMYKAYNRERWVLPVVGPLAEKQA